MNQFPTGRTVLLLAYCIPLTAADEKVDYEWLTKLNSKVVVNTDAIRHQANAFVVTDINRIKVKDEIINRCESMKERAAFRRKLTDLLLRKHSDLGAYALLNQLFPKRKLAIPTEDFLIDQQDIHVRFRTDTHISYVGVRRKTFFRIAQDYWRAELSISASEYRVYGHRRMKIEEAEAQKNNPTLPDFPDFRRNPQKKPSDEPGQR